MSYQDKAAENKRVAKKCMEIQAYNAGVTRAYYSAFQHIKAYLSGKQFDYKLFLQKSNPNEREYSHGTIQAAITNCLIANGKSYADIYKLRVLDNLYVKRRRADYEETDIIEAELRDSLADLDIILSVVT